MVSTVGQGLGNNPAIYEITSPTGSKPTPPHDSLTSMFNSRCTVLRVSRHAFSSPNTLLPTVFLAGFSRTAASQSTEMSSILDFGHLTFSRCPAINAELLGLSRCGFGSNRCLKGALVKAAAVINDKFTDGST